MHPLARSTFFFVFLLTALAVLPAGAQAPISVEVSAPDSPHMEKFVGDLRTGLLQGRLRLEDSPQATAKLEILATNSPLLWRVRLFDRRHHRWLFSQELIIEDQFGARRTTAHQVAKNVARNLHRMSVDTNTLLGIAIEDLVPGEGLPEEFHWLPAVMTTNLRQHVALFPGIWVPRSQEPAPGVVHMSGEVLMGPEGRIDILFSFSVVDGPQVRTRVFSSMAKLEDIARELGQVMVRLARSHVKPGNKEHLSPIDPGHQSQLLVSQTQAWLRVALANEDAESGKAGLTTQPQFAAPVARGKMIDMAEMALSMNSDSLERRKQLLRVLIADAIGPGSGGRPIDNHLYRMLFLLERVLEMQTVPAASRCEPKVFLDEVEKGLEAAHERIVAVAALDPAVADPAVADAQATKRAIEAYFGVVEMGRSSFAEACTNLRRRLIHHGIRGLHLIDDSQRAVDIGRSLIAEDGFHGNALEVLVESSKKFWKEDDEALKRVSDLIAEARAGEDPTLRYGAVRAGLKFHSEVDPDGEKLQALAREYLALSRDLKRPSPLPIRFLPYAKDRIEGEKIEIDLLTELLGDGFENGKGLINAVEWCLTTGRLADLLVRHERPAEALHWIQYALKSTGSARTAVGDGLRRRRSSIMTRYPKAAVEARRLSLTSPKPAIPGSESNNEDG